MKQFFLAFSIAFIGLTLVAPDADARRFGGGRSFGKSTPKYQQQKPTQRSATQQQRQNQGAPTSGARRWLGPLAGLLAGGLLASLFFGDAFDGFQFMDFLLIAALVFGGIWLFRMMRARAQPMARQAHAAAGSGSAQPASYADNSARQDAFETPAIGSGLSADQQAEPGHDPDYRPSWFNEKEFLNGAKTHFVRLQAAWDHGDMKDIREYTTPELFAELTLERQSYGGEKQFTEVVNLDAELLGVAEENDQVIASVRFSGLIREEEGAEAQPFSEVWNVQRAVNEANASWYVSGIQQEKS